MIGLYIPHQDGRHSQMGCWVGMVDELWSGLRTFVVDEAGPTQAHDVDRTEGLILASVEEDYPNADFDVEPLVAVRSSSGWSGEIRVGLRVAGFYQIRKDY